MPAGFYRIQVVCNHRGRPHAGKTRLIARVQWLENDPEDVESFRAAISGQTGGDPEEALQVILMNDRFARKVEWNNRQGRVVRPKDAYLRYDAGDEVVNRTRALAGWRFTCDCGIDRPVRQRTLDDWIRGRIATDEVRRTFQFDISL